MNLNLNVNSDYNFDLNFNSNNLYISDFHVGWHNFEYFAENGENNIFFEKSNAAEKKHQIGFNFTAPSGDFYLKTSGIFDFGKIRVSLFFNLNI